MKDEHFLLLFKTTTLLVLASGDRVVEVFMSPLFTCQQNFDEGYVVEATEHLEEISEKLIRLLEA